MKLTYNTLMRMMDSIDEFYYSHRTQDPDELVAMDLASDRETAEKFISLYPTDPDKALILLICNRYHIDKIYSDSLKTSWSIPVSQNVEYVLDYVKQKREHLIQQMEKNKYRHFSSRKKTVQTAAA